MKDEDVNDKPSEEVSDQPNPITQDEGESSVDEQPRPFKAQFGSFIR